MKPGRYRHYKGRDYIVLGVARHSETREELVVYQQDYGDRGLWVRPKAMFLETVEVEGRQVPRFALVSGAGFNTHNSPSRQQGGREIQGGYSEQPSRGTGF